MGKTMVDLDSSVAAIRIAFLNAIQHGSYEEATLFVQMLNNSLSAKSRITNLPSFTKAGDHLKAELDVPMKARAYCFKWMPIVESAIAKERDKVLSSFG